MVPWVRRTERLFGRSVTALFWKRDVRATVVRALDEFRPDVVNIHNIHGAAAEGWGAGAAVAAAARVPTVWTLHDMWSFTGRCAYSYDCRKFLTGCDASCPTPHEYPSLEPHRIRAAWLEKQAAISSVSLAAVCPSRWLAREAAAGLWSGRRVEVIPYGLPLEVYRPVERGLARQALDIPVDAPVLLCAAQDLRERRKGGGLLMDALRQLRRRPLTLVTLGAGRLELDAPGLRTVPLGYVDHERTKVLAYSAADLLVHPAPVDNLPNVVMEAMACGTPAVGFPVGGVPDMVRPGITGWLATAVTPQALAVALDAALADLADGRNLRDSCRSVAEAEYSDSLQARRYLELFESLRSSR